MRALVLVDGQHAVADVRAAIEHRLSANPGSTVVASALVRPGEKLVDGHLAHLGVPVVEGDYLGAYRVLLSDLVVVTMAEPTFASSGAEVLEKGIRSVAPGVRVVHTVFRPFPLGSIFGSRGFFVTTAPPSPLISWRSTSKTSTAGRSSGPPLVCPTVKVWRRSGRDAGCRCPARRAQGGDGRSRRPRGA